MSSLIEFRREAWGLEKVLFAVQMPERRYRSQVFAARDEEMDRAQIVIMDAPRNLLVSGLFGIGKTFFLEELLSKLDREYKEQVLTIHECLDNTEADISTTILRGLARALREEDDEAAEIDQLMSGIQLTSQTAGKTSGTAEVGIPNLVKIGGGADNTTTATWKRDGVLNAAYEARQLIERAVKRNPERRLIVALDDLDKRDPATIREALVTARPLLHTACAFVLTGHPIGILRNIYSTAGGIFDSYMQLEVLSAAAMRIILERYLQAGRTSKSQYGGVHPFTEDVVEVIIDRALGIPRLLNKICRHILDCAAELRAPLVDADVFRQCWERAGQDLKRSMSEDIARFVEVLQEQTDGFDPMNVPDDVYDRLGVDSHQALLSKINIAIHGDYAVATEIDGKPRITTDPLLEPPPSFS